MPYLRLFLGILFFLGAIVAFLVGTVRNPSDKAQRINVRR